jgi:hypothetical protein
VAVALLHAAGGALRRRHCSFAALPPADGATAADADADAAAATLPLLRWRFSGGGW